MTDGAEVLNGRLMQTLHSILKASLSNKDGEEKEVVEGDDFSQVLISYIKARLIKHAYKEQQYLILYNKVCVCVCKHRCMVIYTHVCMHKYKKNCSDLKT